MRPGKLCVLSSFYLTAFSSLPQIYPALKISMKEVFAVWGWRPVLWDSSWFASVLSSLWQWLQGFGYCSLKSLCLLVRCGCHHVGPQTSSVLQGGMCLLKGLMKEFSLTREAQLGGCTVASRDSANKELNRSNSIACSSLLLPWRKKICFLLIARKVWSALGCNVRKILNSELLHVHSKICSPLNFLLPKREAGLPGPVNSIVSPKLLIFHWCTKGIT